MRRFPINIKDRFGKIDYTIRVTHFIVINDRMFQHRRDIIRPFIITRIPNMLRRIDQKRLFDPSSRNHTLWRNRCTYWCGGLLQALSRNRANILSFLACFFICLIYIALLLL